MRLCCSPQCRPNYAILIIPQVADWAQFHAPALFAALKLAYPKMPHPTTWRNWLRSAVDAALFSQMVSQFFSQAVLPKPSHERASLVVAIDGKVMRHAIPAGRDHGLHLLAAYVPQYGCVLAQAGARTNDFERDVAVDKVSGRVEQRILTSSPMLNAYAPFPHLGQVFRIEREVRWANGAVRHEVGYGLTSLPRTVADAHRLQALVREHWGIENGLHYRRDCSLREDDCINGSANAGELIAAINNLVVGLCRRVGGNLAAVRRRCAAHPDEALALLTS